MLLIVAAYLCGAIPGGYLLNRFVWQRIAPRVARALAGRRMTPLLVRLAPRALSVLADVCKGALVTWGLAMLAAQLADTRGEWTTRPLVSPGLAHGAIVVALVVGHALSVYICGWGGKGIATAMGAFVVLMPWPSVMAMAVFGLVTGLTRRIGMGSIAGTLTLPIAIWYAEPSAMVYIVVAVLLCCYTILVHVVDVLPGTHDEAGPPHA
jgi:glycerol-3-phosphate acyltransferase PlsY